MAVVGKTQYVLGTGEGRRSCRLLVPHTRALRCCLPLQFMQLAFDHSCCMEENEEDSAWQEQEQGHGNGLVTPIKAGAVVAEEQERMTV